MHNCDDSLAGQQIREMVFFDDLAWRSGLELFCDEIDKLSAIVRNPVLITFLGRCPTRTERGYIERRAKNWTFKWQILDHLDDQTALAYLRGEARLAVIPALEGALSYGVLQCIAAGIPFICNGNSEVAAILNWDDFDKISFNQTFRPLHELILQVRNSSVPVMKQARWLQDDSSLWQQLHAVMAKSDHSFRHIWIGEDNGARPLVSVCIVHHNRPQLLKIAIASIANQDYPNFEVIVIDDGSTDPMACKMLAEIEDDFGLRGWLVLRQEHAGVGAARNLAAQRARGDYILFMDDDNCAKQGELKTLIEAALRTNADIVTSFFDVFHGNGEPKPGEQPVRTHLFLGSDAGSGLFENVFGDTNALVRRTKFMELGGFTCDQSNPAEDWRFFATAVLQGAALEVVPEPLFWYRESPGSQSRTLAARVGFSGVLETYKSAVPPELQQLLTCAQGMALRDNADASSVSVGLGSKQAEDRIITREPASKSLVSVCLPVCNGEKYLEAAIRSVLSQTYGDFELLIADDCSHDRTLDIIQKYAKTDSRIKFWANKSKLGLFANYNACISQASGAYIKPFAQDDYWEPEMLERCLSVLKQYSDVALVGTARSWIEQPGYMGINPVSVSADEYFIADKPVAGYDVLKLCLKTLVNMLGEPSCVMFRAEHADTGFSARYGQLGDLEYWLRILMRGDYVFCSDTLCKIRLHEGSTSRHNERTLNFLPDVFRLGAQFDWFLQLAGWSLGEYAASAVTRAGRHAGTLLEEQRMKLEDIIELDLTSSDEEGARFRLSALLALIASYAHGERAEMEASYHADKTNRLIRSLEGKLTELFCSSSWRATRILRELKKSFGVSTAEQGGANVPALNRDHKERQEYIKYLRKQALAIKRSQSWKITAPLRALESLRTASNGAEAVKDPSNPENYEQEIAKRFSLLLEGRVKTPRCLGVVICDGTENALPDAIEDLLKQRHEVLVWDCGSNSIADELIRKYSGSLLEYRKVPQSIDSWSQQLDIAEYVRSNYAANFDWISLSDRCRILEGPRRERSYFDCVRAVFNSPYDYILFDDYLFCSDEQGQDSSAPNQPPKKYRLCLEKGKRIYAWRSHLTDAALVGSDARSGKAFPIVFNARHYSISGVIPGSEIVPVNQWHLDDGRDLKQLPVELLSPTASTKAD